MANLDNARQHDKPITPLGAACLSTTQQTSSPEALVNLASLVACKKFVSSTVKSVMEALEGQTDPTSCVKALISLADRVNQAEDAAISTLLTFCEKSKCPLTAETVIAYTKPFLAVYHSTPCSSLAFDLLAQHAEQTGQVFSPDEVTLVGFILGATPESNPTTRISPLTKLVLDRNEHLTYDELLGFSTVALHAKWGPEPISALAEYATDRNRTMTSKEIDAFVAISNEHGVNTDGAIRVLNEQLRNSVRKSGEELSPEQIFIFGKSLTVLAQGKDAGLIPSPNLYHFRDYLHAKQEPVTDGEIQATAELISAAGQHGSSALKTLAAFTEIEGHPRSAAEIRAYEPSFKTIANDYAGKYFTTLIDYAKETGQAILPREMSAFCQIFGKIGPFLESRAALWPLKLAQAKGCSLSHGELSCLANSMDATDLEHFADFPVKKMLKAVDDMAKKERARFSLKDFFLTASLPPKPSFTFEDKIVIITAAMSLALKKLQPHMLLDYIRRSKTRAPGTMIFSIDEHGRMIRKS